MKIHPNLHSAPYQWDFYQAVRELERAFPEAPRLGVGQNPEREKVRLGQKPSTSFAPSTIASAELDKKQRIRLQSYFLGMFGPQGPLPLHLTEVAMDRQRDAHDSTLIDFMDIFHHRMLSLFYRVWANKEPAVHYERPEQDRFHLYLGALFGIGMASLHNRDAMPDNSKLHFAGHLSAQTRHAEGLARIMQSFFAVPVKIEEFIGEWLEIPAESRCRLGTSLTFGGLGQDTVLGGKSWQRQNKFRVVIGPMTLQEYESLLPGKNKLQLVTTIIRNYLGFELSWDIRLILAQKEIPETRLGSYGQLGLTSWLHNQQATKDSDALLVA